MLLYTCSAACVEKKLDRRAQAEFLVYPHVSQHDLVQRLCMYVFVLAGAF